MYCYRCKQVKSDDSFPPSQVKRKRSSHLCKPCRKEYHYEWYWKNIERNLARARKCNAARRAAIARTVARIKDRPCFDCGVHYPAYVLDFDHREGTTKLFTIGNNTNAKSMAAVLDEMAKCDLVCTNCHRERTHARLVKSKSRGATNAEVRVEVS